MVELVELSDAYRAAMATGIDAFASLLGVKVPDGWPAYPEVFSKPGDPGWPLFLFVDRGASCIVGNGGFLGPPDSNEIVQIGYEVAPEYRGQGIATRAMREIISRKPKARLAAAVAVTNLPSIAVLRRLGLRNTGQSVEQDGEALLLWINR